MKPTSLDELIASAAIEMARESSLPATIDRVVSLVVDTVPPCDAASVFIFEGGHPVRVVASDEAIRDLVDEHAHLNSAPALTAFQECEPVYSPDLSTEQRWPAYADALSQRLGIRTLYALPLRLQAKPMGVLVLYAKTVDAFDGDDQESARILALHATAALGDAVQHEQLTAALASRTVIGQATGMVMERFDLDAASAFSVLRRLSQTHNVKLRDLATQVVETGRLG